MTGRTDGRVVQPSSSSAGDPWGSDDPPDVDNPGGLDRLRGTAAGNKRVRNKQRTRSKRNDSRQPVVEPPVSRHSGRAVDDATERTKARWRSLWLFAVAVVVVVAATWFSNAQSVEDIAIDGEIGVRSEAALSAAAVSQNRVAQAVLLTRASELGLAAPTEAEAAVSSSASAIAELDLRIAQLLPDAQGAAASISQASVAFTDHLRDALNELAVPNVVAADDALMAAEEAFPDLAVELARLRDGALNDIVVARETAGQVAIGARILVAFLIPMVTVLAYRFIVVRTARRRELQRELRAEREMLQAKDELIANISHELRTPLTGILGFAQEAALTDGLTVDDHQMMAGVVAGEADELSRMVDDLITTARDQEDALGLVIEAVDPNTEVKAVQLPAVIAGRDIDIDLPEGAHLMVDRLRLRQIMRNLVSNALKYGGPNVAVRGRVDDGLYHFSVIDDGDGVPRALEERLFSRFLHQGDTPLMTGSVGLGLSIAHRLAEVMGGSLTYRRESGNTVFELTLPSAYAPAPAKTKA